ncbi:MAG TPA: hypothetical protein V6C65_39425 [Allocoleopsis sp.]
MRVWVFDTLPGHWVNLYYVRRSDGTQSVFKLIHNGGQTFRVESIDGRLSQDQMALLLCDGAIDLPVVRQN